MPGGGPLGQGRPARNGPKALEKLAKTDAGIKTVLIPASLFGAQGRSGGPLGRPTQPFPLGEASPGNLAKTLVKPYVSAVRATGTLRVASPGTELMTTPSKMINSVENNKNQEN